MSTQTKILQLVYSITVSVFQGYLLYLSIQNLEFNSFANLLFSCWITFGIAISFLALGAPENFHKQALNGIGILLVYQSVIIVFLLTRLFDTNQTLFLALAIPAFLNIVIPFHFLMHVRKLDKTII